MTQLVGKYETVAEEGMKDFILDLAKNTGKEDLLEHLKSLKSETKPTVEIEAEENKYTITTMVLGKTLPITFTAGVEFEEKQPGGGLYKSIASVTDSSITINSYAPDSSGKREYKVDHEGMVLSIESDKTALIGKTIFKRITA